MNQRERQLLILFVSALGCAVLIFGGSWFFKYWQSRNALLEATALQLQESQRWMAQADDWLAKYQWTQENPPPAYAGAQSEALFVRETQESLSRHEIRIIDQKLSQAVAEGNFLKSGVHLTLEASLESLVRWLHETQQVENFAPSLTCGSKAVVMIPK